MQESNVQTFGTLTWLLVDEADTLAVALGQCVGYTVLDAESYMVDTLVTFVKPFLNGALR